MRMLLAALVLALTTVAARACPDVNLDGRELRYTAAEVYQAKAFSVIAGGTQNLENCRIQGVGVVTGWVASAPDFELYYTRSSGRALEIRVNSACDSVLLINTAGGNWYFDDDDNGAADAGIRLNSPTEGWYDIWIGTYGASNCDAQLVLESF